MYDFFLHCAVRLLVQSIHFHFCPATSMISFSLRISSASTLSCVLLLLIILAVILFCNFIPMIEKGGSKGQGCRLKEMGWDGVRGNHVLVLVV